ncbi:hypothetical protein [Micromonospora sp. NPDC005806]
MLTYGSRPDEANDDGDSAVVVGLYGRSKRDRDGHELRVVQVEDKRPQ